MCVAHKFTPTQISIPHLLQTTESKHAPRKCCGMIHIFKAKFLGYIQMLDIHQNMIQEDFNNMSEIRLADSNPSHGMFFSKKMPDVHEEDLSLIKINQVDFF